MGGAWGDVLNNRQQLRMYMVGMAASLALAGGSAYGQTASQVTPPSYAPPVVQQGGQVVLPQSAGPQAPPGADKIMIRLNDVSISGMTAADGTAAQLRRELTGRQISVADIYAAAQALEQRLIQDGAAFTRVVVPQQDLQDGGTVRLEIVRGYIERVDTSKLPSSIRGAIAEILAPLEGSEAPTMAEIERRVLLAGDTPGVRLRSTLAAGSKPGATLLVIEAHYRPVELTLTAGNSLSESLGRESYGIGFNFNSVLGLGESIYLRANGLPTLGRETSFLHPTPRNRSLAGGIVLPLGRNGLNVNVELTDARTSPRHLATQPGVTSRFRRAAFRLNYPLIRSRSTNVVLRGVFDMQDERVSIYTPAQLPLSYDDLRVLRGGADASFLFGNGGNARLSGMLSLGIDALGARSAADAHALLPLSRAGADADFQKAELEFGLVQPVAQHLHLALNGAAQTSFGKPLLNSEQFGLARTDGISPAPQGTLQGDAGYLLRGEVRAPFVWPLDDGSAAFAPYAFGATGGIRLEQPTLFERATTKAHSYGLGARLSFGGDSGSPAISAGLEYGHADVQGLSDDDRLTFYIYTQF